MITFLFGKSCEDKGTIRTKMARFYYKAVVVFYFVVLLLSALYSLLNKEFPVGFIMSAIIIPLLFRLVYFILLRLNGFNKEK